MSSLLRGLKGLIFDLRTVVGLCGVLLSIVFHELLHVMMHFGEITEVNVLPDSRAIVEIIFTPQHDYDLVAEEAIAYTITMIVLVLTAMLIAEINDVRDDRNVQQILSASSGLESLDIKDYKLLSSLVGLES